MHTSNYSSPNTNSDPSHSSLSKEVDPNKSSNDRPAWKAVFTVTERTKGKRIWIRIGTAFVNRDSSLTILLDALPVGNQLHVRTPFAPNHRIPEPETDSFERS